MLCRRDGLTFPAEQHITKKWTSLNLVFTKCRIHTESDISHLHYKLSREEDDYLFSKPGSGSR